MPLVVILIAIAVLILVLFFSRRAPESLRLETTGQPTTEREGDRMVIEQLKRAGSNLSKPHPIDFYLYFPNQNSAKTAAEELRAAGFETRLQT